MIQDSRHMYHTLLLSPLESEQFVKHIAVLLDSDPYFMPAYIDMLVYADARRDEFLYRKILTYALDVSWSIYMNNDTKKTLCEQWSSLELDALKDLLGVARREKRLSLSKRIRTDLQYLLADTIVISKTIQSSVEPQSLKRLQIINSTEIQDEVSKLAPYWWQIDESRSEKSTPYQNMWSIVLRALPERTKEFKMRDGYHESLVTHHATRLPRIHNMVVSFAKDFDVGLGEVKIVAMKQFTRLCWHTNLEEHLDGRKRYYFVIHSMSGDTLEAGIEKTDIKPGELWFLDNKVMYREQNNSPSTCTYVVFDGYPLNQVAG